MFSVARHNFFLVFIFIHSYTLSSRRLEDASVSLNAIFLLQAISAIRDQSTCWRPTFFSLDTKKTQQQQHAAIDYKLLSGIASLSKCCVPESLMRRGVCVALAGFVTARPQALMHWHTDSFIYHIRCSKTCGWRRRVRFRNRSNLKKNVWFCLLTFV